MFLVTQKPCYSDIPSRASLDLESVMLLSHSDIIPIITYSVMRRRCFVSCVILWSSSLISLIFLFPLLLYYMIKIRIRLQDCLLLDKWLIFLSLGITYPGLCLIIVKVMMIIVVVIFLESSCDALLLSTPPSGSFCHRLPSRLFRS